MVLIPAGSFTMGSPATEPGHDIFLTEGPERRVNIRQFAVGKYESRHARGLCLDGPFRNESRPGWFLA